MEHGSTASTETRIAKALMAALFLLTAVRAALLSVTPPEAAMYNQFVGPGPRDALAANWVNAPVLYALLARLSTSAFHLTDLSLRLPSLLAAMLYFSVAWRLSTRLFGRNWLMLTAITFLTLNPFVLDDLAVATGAGLGLAFWLWAVEFILAKRFHWAGVCAALSLCASFSFLLPAALLAFFVPRRQLLPEFGLRAMVTAFLVLVIPFNHARIGPIRFSRMAAMEQPALFLIPVLAFGVLRLVQCFRQNPSPIGAIVFAGLSLLDFRPQRYSSWPEYAGGRTAIKAIRQAAGPKPVRIFASPALDAVLEFYRARYALGFWSKAEAGPADYYLLFPRDDREILQHRLHVVWQDAHLTVARPGSEPPGSAPRP